MQQKGSRSTMMVKYTYSIVPKRDTTSNVVAFDSSTATVFDGSTVTPMTVSIVAKSPLHDNVRNVKDKLRDLVGNQIIDNARKITLIEAEELPMYEVPRVR